MLLQYRIFLVTIIKIIHADVTDLLRSRRKFESKRKLWVESVKKKISDCYRLEQTTYLTRKITIVYLYTFSIPISIYLFKYKPSVN